MNVFKLIEDNGLKLDGDIEHFAELVAQQEREACAKVCEQPVDEIQITDDCSEYKYRDNQECADAIRARGSDAA